MNALVRALKADVDLLRRQEAIDALRDMHRNFLYSPSEGEITVMMRQQDAKWEHYWTMLDREIAP